MMNVIKRVVGLLMVSMVLFPSAAYADATGGITLDVQPDGTSDAPVADDGSWESDYPTDAAGNRINPWEQVRCSYNSITNVPDCTPYVSYNSNATVDASKGYIWNSWYCLGVYSRDGVPLAGAVWSNEFLGSAVSNDKGIMCFHKHSITSNGDDWSGEWDSLFQEVQAPNKQDSITRTFKCYVAVVGSMPIGCDEPDDYNTGSIGMDSMAGGGFLYVSIIRYPRNARSLLSSLPFTGSHDLLVVVGLVVVAVVVIVIIRRWSKWQMRSSGR